MIDDAIQRVATGSGKAARRHARPGLGLAQKWWEWRAQRKAIRQLSRLDDRMLQDMGISRSQIGSAVRHGSPFDAVK